MKPGDTVIVIDDDLEGIVQEVNGNIVRIETVDGFEIDFHKEDIILVKEQVSIDAFVPNNISEVLKSKTDKKNKNQKRVKPKERVLPAFEVDLHIHQLVKSQKGLSNHEMLEIQLDTAKRQLEFAIKKRMQRVVFIHGIGAGVLRKELEYLFKQYDQVSFEDADFQKYGRGATEIYIFQNKI